MRDFTWSFVYFNWWYLCSISKSYRQWFAKRLCV